MCPSFSPTCVQMVCPFILYNISARLHSMRCSVVLSMFQNCTSAVSAVFYAAVRFASDACITFVCSLNYVLVQPELRCCLSTSCAFVCKHFYSTNSKFSLTSLWTYLLTNYFRSLVILHTTYFCCYILLLWSFMASPKPLMRQISKYLCYVYTCRNYRPLLNMICLLHHRVYVTSKILPVVHGTQILSLTKHCGQVVSTLVLYLEGPKFVCWFGKWLIFTYTFLDSCRHLCSKLH